MFTVSVGKPFFWTNVQADTSVHDQTIMYYTTRLYHLYLTGITNSSEYIEETGQHDDHSNAFR